MATVNIMSILQSAYAAPTQSTIPAGAKFSPVDPTQWQGTWTGTDVNKKPVTVTISAVSGYRANVRFTTATGGTQTQRVFITTKNLFRIGDSQMQLTAAGKMTISTVVTDPTTGNQSMETDYATQQS
jgi:hypothetical protein